MPERRRHKQHPSGHAKVARHLAARNHPLQVRQRAGKEPAIPRADQQRPIAQVGRPSVERHHNQFLLLQPSQRLLPRLVEALAKPVLIRRLVRRQAVANHHGIRIAPPQPQVREVHRNPVARLGHHRLHHAPNPRHIERRLEDTFVLAIRVPPIRRPRPRAPATSPAGLPAVSGVLTSRAAPSTSRTDAGKSRSIHPV
jgi:hypothetical protein